MVSSIRRTRSASILDINATERSVVEETHKTAKPQLPLTVIILILLTVGCTIYQAVESYEQAV